MKTYKILMRKNHLKLREDNISKWIVMKYVIQGLLSKYSHSINIGMLAYFTLLQYPNLIHTHNYWSCMCPVIEICSDKWCNTLQVRNKQMEVEVFYELLHNLRQELGFSNLTSRSQQLLMRDHSNWKSFVDQYKDIPLKRQVWYVVLSVKLILFLYAHDH